MHNLQKILLARLKNNNGLRYADLTSGYDFEDNIVFHLKQLIKEKFIEKENKKYFLTLQGVKEIAKYEPLQLEDKGVKTFFVGFLCKDTEGHFLIKEHPQAKTNFYNLPSGKPIFGEKMEDSLARLFFLNTGLKVDAKRFTFKTLHLKTIETQEEVIFDDAFTIYSVEISKQEKSQMQLIAPVKWYSYKEISLLPNKWPEIDICILDNDKSVYRTYTHISSYIL